jgi:hypothetical protein
MKELRDWTPIEIDTALSEIWERARRHYSTAWGLRGTAAAAKNCGFEEKAALKLKAAEKEDAKGRAVLVEAEPYEAEYKARGRWNRYFLVVSSDGHVHRERNCSTCFRSTEYAWLIELADHDEGDLVLQYGERACTVCFPNAPALKGWGQYKARERADRKREREAKAAEKRAATVPVPELNKTFKTERSAEIELVSRFCQAIHRDGLFERDPAGYPHCRGLAIEDRWTARAICKALGKKRGVRSDAVEMALDKRVVAKLKRDGR